MTKAHAAIKISFTFTNAPRIHTGLLVHEYGCEVFGARIESASVL